MTHIRWNWQQDDWAAFTCDNCEIEKLERDSSGQSGFSFGIARHLSSEDHKRYLFKKRSPEKHPLYLVIVQGELS